MKKVAVILVIAMACLTGSAMAITHADANSRFHNYIRGRCGLKIGPFPIWVCQGYVVSGCKLVGNQINRPQWTCSGQVYERRGWANPTASDGRGCVVWAQYAPSGKRLRGGKGPCVALGPPTARDRR